MNERPTILLVHGAWHGAWAWDRLRAELERRGWTVRTLDLPSAHTGDLAAVRLADDVAAVDAAITAIDGPVAVIAHSYGGVPVTQVAVAESVVQVIYIAAFALDVGESLLSSIGGVAPPWWHVEAGVVTLGPDRDAIAARFYADLDDAEAFAAIERLTPQSLAPLTEPITRAAWRSKPTSYVIAERELPERVTAQSAMAARAGSRVFRMPTSHSPFLSRPLELADVIESALAEGIRSGPAPESSLNGASQ
jgi:pimeloyl-ACP methyl ester carboxylesterase